MTKLTQLRDNTGLLQIEVADALGLTQGAVSQWETGLSTPRTDLLPKIAKLYGCTVDELLREDEETTRLTAGRLGRG